MTNVCKNKTYIKKVNKNIEIFHNVIFYEMFKVQTRIG